MSRGFYVLLPLAILIILASIACLTGYGLVQLVDTLPLDKTISKTTLILLVLAIFPAMRYLQLSKEDLGFAGRVVFIRQLGWGFALGLSTLLPVFLVLYAVGVNVVDETKSWGAAWLIEKISVALLLALLISLLEEPLFRGVLLAGLRKKLSAATAIVSSAGYYAALHFLTSKTKIALQDLTLTNAFRLMGDAFANLLNPAIYPAFWPLLMVGIFLGVLRTRIRTGLGLCIGCHAAWVWQIKMGKELFNTDMNSPYLWLVSSYDGVIGPLVTVWLIVSMMGYWCYQKYLMLRSRAY